MRQKTARERTDGAGWHYVSAGRAGGHPIGYCAEHDPHPTEQAARECYGQFVRDSIKLDAGSCGWTSCSARPGGVRCPNPTQKTAKFGDDGYGMTTLCPEHMTVDDVIAVEQLAGPAGDAWIS